MFIQFLHESAEQHEKFKDHTKNPFYKVIAKYGLKHVKTELTRNNFAPKSLGDKADITVHTYIGPNDNPEKPSTKVVVEQDHVRGQGGYVRSDDKGYDWRGGYRQDNGIWSPASGSTKPGLESLLKDAGLKPLNEGYDEDNDYDPDEDDDDTSEDELKDAIEGLQETIIQKLLRKELRFENGMKFFPKHQEGRGTNASLRGYYEDHPEFGEIDDDTHEFNDILEKLSNKEIRVYDDEYEITKQLDNYIEQLLDYQEELENLDESVDESSCKEHHDDNVPDKKTPYEDQNDGYCLKEDHAAVGDLVKYQGKECVIVSSESSGDSEIYYIYCDAEDKEYTVAATDLFGKKPLKESSDSKHVFKIDGMPKDTEYNRMSFGRQIDYRNKIAEFQKTAKKGHISAKGKSMAAGFKEFKKLYQAKQWYYIDRDASHWHDDSTEVWYKV